MPRLFRLLAPRDDAHSMMFRHCQSPHGLAMLRPVAGLYLPAAGRFLFDSTPPRWLTGPAPAVEVSGVLPGATIQATAGGVRLLCDRYRRDVPLPARFISLTLRRPGG